MVKIVWTEFALEDLSLIHEYISKDSKVYADRVIDKIINRVDQLQAFPKSGRVVPEFNEETLRELIQGNYRIIYKISSAQVSIIRIHHSAQLLK
jgi:addiction module RelE/StbE family toxin